MNKKIESKVFNGVRYYIEENILDGEVVYGDVNFCAKNDLECKYPFSRIGFTSEEGIKEYILANYVDKGKDTFENKFVREETQREVFNKYNKFLDAFIELKGTIEYLQENGLNEGINPLYIDRVLDELKRGEY
jgi:hypothetical protein